MYGDQPSISEMTLCTASASVVFWVDYIFIDNFPSQARQMRTAIKAEDNPLTANLD